MSWQVFLKKHAAKQMTKLPKYVSETVLVLANEIEVLGPLRHNWKNFCKLKGTKNLYHCHLKQRKPTYVACWEVKDKNIKIVEVYYVGTHEKAPY
ncbi:hypothetical protein KAT92_00400 [Candidatus Babeliales bacterium]|nr:hypothetical protein [Candidatus Babeliales bacterium]